MQSILDYLSKLGRLVADSFWWFFTEFYSWVVDGITSLINSALSHFGYNVTVDWIPEVYSTINFFVPLNELLSMLSILFLFWVYIFVLKIVLKAIPTLW